MSEQLNQLRDRPRPSLMLGLASVTATVSLMGGCSTDKDSDFQNNDDAAHHETAPFRCVGIPSYIEYPSDSEYRPYVVMNLVNKDGSVFRGATKVALSDLGRGYSETITELTHEGQATRALVTLPPDVVQLAVEVYAGKEHTSCTTSLYPDNPLPTFTDVPPPPPVTK